MSEISKIKKEVKQIEKKNKLKEKELMKEVKQRENEFDSKYDKDHPKEKDDIFSVLKNIKESDDMEKELYDHMSEDEKKEVADMKLYTKHLIIKLVVIFVVVIIGTCVGGYVLNRLSLTDLEKVTIPLMEDYYNNKYSSDNSVDDIKELCRTEYDEKGSTQVVCDSKIYVGTLDNDKHVISVNNELMGDDSGYSTIKNNYIDYILNYLSDMNIVDQDANLSYKDYYTVYNMYHDYSNVMPNGLSVEDLISSGKLSAMSVITYTGNINLNEIYDLLNQLSDDSVFYLIKQVSGIPTNLTVISKSVYYDMNITSSTKKDQNITYYELDRNVDGLQSLTLTEVNKKDIVLLDSQYVGKKGYLISYEKEYANRDEEEKPGYWFLAFDNNVINDNSLIQMESNYNGYSELEKDDYENLVVYKSGGVVYMIGNFEIGIANYGTNDSWLCTHLNIC